MCAFCVPLSFTTATWAPTPTTPMPAANADRRRVLVHARRDRDRAAGVERGVVGDAGVGDALHVEDEDGAADPDEAAGRRARDAEDLEDVVRDHVDVAAGLDGRLAAVARVDRRGGAAARDVGDRVRGDAAADAVPAVLIFACGAVSALADARVRLRLARRRSSTDRCGSFGSLPMFAPLMSCTAWYLCGPNPSPAS